MLVIGIAGQVLYDVSVSFEPSVESKWDLWLWFNCSATSCANVGTIENLDLPSEVKDKIIAARIFGVISLGGILVALFLMTICGCTCLSCLLCCDLADQIGSIVFLLYFVALGVLNAIAFANIIASGNYYASQGLPVAKLLGSFCYLANMAISILLAVWFACVCRSTLTSDNPKRNHAADRHADRV